jgi:hypothetical protein
VIIPGNVDGSLLAQKILGKQTQGDKMPPNTSMSQDEIQTILEWIKAGAPNGGASTPTVVGTPTPPPPPPTYTPTPAEDG